MATDMDSDDLTPGLHVFREAAPLERAGSLAATLGADLCATLDEADAAVASRQAMPAADAGALESLRALAERVASADRIARRTHERAVAEISERMASIGAGMAVHPSTIRERATAVLQARTGLQQADQLLEANDAVEAEDRPAPPPVEPVAPEPVAAPPAPKRKRGLFGFLRRRRVEELEDTRESTDLLRSMSAATEEAFGARRASAARADQRSLLGARRDSAAEMVRVTERAWHDLAGEGADPNDVDEVLRRLDPQHQDAVVVAHDTASVRAASTMFDGAVARWQAAWADLDAEAPAPTEALASVEDLRMQLAKALVLVGAATERRLALADAAPAAPVVVIEGLLEPAEQD